MRLSIFILMLFSLASCKFKKITKISLQNNNSYASAVTITANNIMHKIGPIAGGQKIESIMDWTNIDKINGYFIIELQDGNGNKIQSYNHGAFEKGELYNHIQMVVEGNEIQVKIMN
jgi:hypothetical protein